MFGNTLNFDHQPEGKPSLSSLEDVGAIVQRFAAATLADYNKFGNEEVSRDEAMGSIHARAAEVGGIFMGKDPAYHATEWNSENRLGAHIRAQDAIKFKFQGQDPGEAFFEFLALQVVHAANELQGGQESDVVGLKLQSVVRSSVKFLMTGAG